MFKDAVKATREYGGVVWAPGKKFRVIKEGGRLSGWTPKPGYQQGWTRELHVGDVIVCEGTRWGWGSDPGYGVGFIEEGVNCPEFWPSEGGAFGYHPAPGYLEEVQDGD